jgi:pimeloyl-ACP methyl ester carboxylesterase
MGQTLRAAMAGLKAIQLRVFSPPLQLFDFISHFGVSSPMLPAKTLDVGPSQHSFQEQHSICEANNETSSEEFILPDGRKLGIAYYGALTGPTVFYLHGFPGCRLSGALFDSPGKKLGARIIAVDRPGIGISSPQPGREPLDHANDIRTLAEHLNIESYGIIGVSGGGPYALACAYSIPEENLKSISIIGGMGPIDIGLKGMNWSNWLIFKGFTYFPTLIRWLQNKVISVLQSVPTDKIVELVSRKKSINWPGYSKKDITDLQDPRNLTMLLDCQREHFKQGVDGHMEEGRVFTSDLGFRVEDIRPSIPIQLWYGKQDTNVPLRMGEAIAARLSSRPDLYVIDDEAHLGLILRYSFNALERLLEKMGGSLGTS